MAPMNRTRWLRDLEEATSERDVIGIARDYLAFLTRTENALLPLKYRPGPINDVSDIGIWLRSLRAARHEVAGSSALEGLLAEMSAFFGAAEDRLLEGALTVAKRQAIPQKT